ncbi:MAG: GTPase Era [Christensenellales bacterium]|jgi:GTP-binding protein Era
MTQAFKSGFATVIGRPNVGKSTLVNALVGEKVAIVSPRPQTTRTNLQGILTREHYQMVFIDTPGLHAARTRLGEYMVRMAQSALDEVEAVVVVLDAMSGLREGDLEIVKNALAGSAPVMAVINKIDIAGDEKVAPIIAKLAEFRGIAHILPVSAKTGKNIDTLEALLEETLPEGPLYFPPDMITDQPERVIAAEMIREKALYRLREEVPHGIGVEMMQIQARNDGVTDMHATIYCEKQSHKRILIGKNGAMLKEIGIGARREIEALMGCPINLQLWVKVRKDWRNRPDVLRELGYQ